MSIKERQKAHWNGVAEGWSAWLEWTERNFEPVTSWLAGAAGWEPGAHVLDVACGSGYPARAAARCVRPNGTVAATDISPDMIAAAARGARAAGLDHIEFLEMDAEELQFEDESFAAATNAYGLMFCPDPRRAVAEVHRVLRPGGRFALVTWDDASKSPFFSLFAGVAPAFFSLPSADPEAPGPFRLTSSATLESLLRANGFSDVRVECCSMTVECASIAEYGQMFADLAWKSRLASLSAADSARFREAIAEAAQPYLDGQRLRLGAASLCASGRKRDG